MRDQQFLVGALTIAILCTACTATQTLPAAPFSEKIESDGGVDGGGGRGSVCRNADGSIRSAESLDLYEGRAMYGFKIQRSNIPMIDQLQAALARIPNRPGDLVRFYVERVLQHIKFTPLGSQLTPVDDSFEAVLPAGCVAEQAARYYNDRLILVNQDIWDAMGETDRAGLVLHEAVYAANRAAGATDSRQSRHIVGSLFDSSTAWTDVQQGVPQNALFCISPGFVATGFWAYPDSSGNWRLQFSILGRGFVFSKKTAFVIGANFNFDEARQIQVLRGTDKIGMGITSSETLKSDFEDNDVILLSKKWEAPKDSQGQPIPGFQTLRYYLSWQSGSYPDSRLDNLPLNCSATMK